MSKPTNGLGVLTGNLFLREKFHLPGSLRLEMLLILNILIGMPNPQRLPACPQKSNKDILLISDHQPSKSVYNNIFEYNHCLNARAHLAIII